MSPEWSKKLLGMGVALGALLVLFIAYVIASIWVDISDAVAVAVTSAISTMGLGHQASQGAVDRASAQAGTYRPVQPTPVAPAPPPPGSTGSHIP